MARKASIKLAAMLGIITLAFSSSATAFAADAATTTTTAPPASPSAALSVSPPTASLNAVPGTTLTQKITLNNISDDERNVSVQIQNFTPSGEEGQAQLSDGEGKYSLSQWMSSDPASATLAPHATQDFVINIKVPTDAPPGGHFGAVVFSPAAGATSGGAELSVVSQVTSLILLKVPGDVNEKASVAGINICKGVAVKVDSTATSTADNSKTCDKSVSFLQKGPVGFTARLQNQGNVQVEPQGTLTVTNMFGHKVATLNVKQHNLLPDSVRRFDTLLQKKSLFGRYTVKYQLNYGDTKPQTLTASKTFWVLPLTTIGIVVVVIVVLFLILWLPRKRLKKAFKAFATAGND